MKPTRKTSKGIEAIAPIAGQAVLDGENLKYAMKNIRTAIEKVRTDGDVSGRSNTFPLMNLPTCHEKRHRRRATRAGLAKRWAL